MKKAETKYYDFANEDVQLYHNTGVTGGAHIRSLFWDPWQLIPQGTNRYNRIGDTISPTGMKINLWISNKADRVNVLYRIVACIVPRSYNGGQVTWGSIDPAPVVQSGACGNYAILPWDKEKGIKVLYDRTFTISGKWQTNAAGALKECSKKVKLYIKRKRAKTIKYTQGGVPINNIMALYVIPYDAYGTLTTDDIASCAYHARLYFKDP
jgi:hypothetical protein